MRFTKRARLGAGLLVVAAGLLFLPAAASAAGDDGNPQLKQKPGVLAAVAAPEACKRWAQSSTDVDRNALTFNAPRQYTTATVGTDFFNVTCGSLIFSLPRDSEAWVNLSASAELDCQAPQNLSNNTTPTDLTNGWCEGRFLINGAPLPDPNNTDRGDTLAWDSSNGGNNDWQSNIFEQEYRATCPRLDNVTTPCTFRVQLQSRLDNGANYLWVDDLNVKVNVNRGKVSVTTVTP